MTSELSLAKLTALVVALHAGLFVATDVGLRAANAALKPFGPADLGSVAWTNQYHYTFASKAMGGKIPYRDFRFEYPVLAFPLLLIPRLMTPDVEYYRLGFTVEMFLFDVAAIVLIASHCGRGQNSQNAAGRFGWYTLYCALLAPLVIGRYDLAPTAFAFAGALWWFSERRKVAGIAVGLGTLLKLYPGVVAAIGMVDEARCFRHCRPEGTIAFLITLVAGAAIWFSLGGVRVVESLAYQSQRGVEVQSLYGGALFMIGTITGTKVSWENNYNAYHVASEWGTRLSSITIPLQALALVGITRRFRQSRSIDGLRYSAAAILSFVTFCKVLSPQFLIWLFPFLAVMEGRTGFLARRIFLLVCISTALFYPGPGYAMMLNHDTTAILLLNLRNLLLVWLLTVLVARSTSEEARQRQ